jgi:hypothetical protein
LSEGFTGSEIEQAVTDALYDCFDQGKELDTESIVRAIDGTVPLSITMAEQIRKLRQWAGNRARRASSSNGADGTRRIAAKMRTAAAPFVATPESGSGNRKERD